MPNWTCNTDTRYVYLVTQVTFDLKHYSGADLTETLNNYGKDNWELVSIATTRTNTDIIFEMVFIRFEFDNSNPAIYSCD